MFLGFSLLQNCLGFNKTSRQCTAWHKHTAPKPSQYHWRHQMPACYDQDMCTHRLEHQVRRGESYTHEAVACCPELCTDSKSLWLVHLSRLDAHSTSRAASHSASIWQVQPLVLCLPEDVPVGTLVSKGQGVSALRLKRLDDSMRHSIADFRRQMHSACRSLSVYLCPRKNVCDV